MVEITETHWRDTKVTLKEASSFKINKDAEFVFVESVLGIFIPLDQVALNNYYKGNGYKVEDNSIEDKHTYSVTSIKEV